MSFRRTGVAKDGSAGMTMGRLKRMVASGESEVFEFKKTTGAHRKAAKTACAMLNQHGGQVLFGVTPNGRVCGQKVSDRTIEQLSAELSKLDPPAFPTIERVPIGVGLEVVVVAVGSGSTKPYAYLGRAYRRVGNTTVAMRANEYNQMLFERMHKEQRWENQLAEGWSIGDLDTGEIQGTVNEAVRRGRLQEPETRAPIDLLRGLGLLREGALLRSAVALFGNADRMIPDMPQCLLRVARFRGADRSEFLDNRQFRGNIFSLLRTAERFLLESLPIAGRFEDGRFERIDEPLYPPLATREALANAFCHRDYSIGGGSVGVAIYDDRLEVTSTGTLHFGMTPEKLFAPHESVPWNPLIADVFYRRGIIERWGRGTLKMAEVATAAGLPLPEILDAGGCVTVRFRPAKPRSRGPLRAAAVSDAPDGFILNELQQAVLDALLRSEKPLALREIHSDLIQLASVRQVRRALTRLRELRLASATGHGASSRWQPGPKHWTD